MDANLIDLTADIVSSYVGNNTVATADLPALIQQVHDAFPR
ncbi:MucR family transcriptional regulator [Roseibium album]